MTFAHVRMPIAHVRMPIAHVRTPIAQCAIAIAHVRTPIAQRAIAIAHVRMPIAHVRMANAKCADVNETSNIVDELGVRTVCRSKSAVKLLLHRHCTISRLFHRKINELCARISFS